MRAVLAEWTKVRTTGGAAALLVATAVATTGLGLVVGAFPSAGDGTRATLGGDWLGRAPVAVLGVLAIGGEYGTGLIRTTLVAVPNRAAVLVAKAVVLAVPVAATGSLALLVTGLLTDPPDPPAAVGHLVLASLLGLGVAAVVRDSGAAIGTVLGLLYLPPVLTQLVADPHLRHQLDQLAPSSALGSWTAGALVLGALRFGLSEG